MGISNGSPLKRLPAALPARLPLQRTSTDPGNHDRNRHGNGFPAVYQYRRLQKSLFMLDTSFEHFHYLPNTPEGEVLLKLLVHPEIMEKLDNLLLSDLGCRSDSIPLEHDATDASGNPILLAYDFDMQRINRFNTGLNVYGRSGNLICFDFQIPVLKKYLTATIHFSSIDLCKFKRGFLHEP